MVVAILEDKIILEPSAGTGNIVSFLQNRGAAEVLACEKDEDFAKLLAQKCRVIANDFFTVTSDQISHIHAIYMNPRFQPMQNTSFMPGTLPRLAAVLCRFTSTKNKKRKTKAWYGFMGRAGRNSSKSMATPLSWGNALAKPTAQPMWKWT